MSDFPSVNFEALATKYKTLEGEATYRADQLENIAGTLKEERDQAREELANERQLTKRLTEQLQQHATESVIIPGETVKD